MMNFWRKNYLLLVVFLTGAASLIVEVVAFRILSPYFGNTIYVVSSVIGVVLGALSFGYYAGGVLADRYPSSRWFFGIVFLSGLSVIFIRLLIFFTLPVLSAYFSITGGPLIASIILFFLPSFLLGMLSPFAIKLRQVNFPEEGVGRIAGEVFFWSTFGSIAGSLTAGFALIPQLGINLIILSLGIALMTIGAAGFGGLTASGFGAPGNFLRRNSSLPFLLFFLIIAGAASFFFENEQGVIYSRDGVYEKITIQDADFQGQPARFLYQDRSASAAMFLDSSSPADLVFDYTKYYALYKLFKPAAKTALAIGAGGYSIPKALLNDLPDIQIDAVDIEPSLPELGRLFFQVPETPRLNDYLEDGRRFLSRTSKNYDLIFSDVYFTLFSVPAHFTTEEFFSLAKKKLNPDGVFIANFIGGLSRRQPSFIFSELKTFQTVFPNSYFFATQSPKQVRPQNIIFLGVNNDQKINFRDPAIQKNLAGALPFLGEKLIDPNRFELSAYQTLTDDYSPVEYLTASVIKSANDDQSVFFSGEEALALVDQQLRYGPRFLSAGGHKKVQDFLIAETKALADKTEIQRWIHQSAGGTEYQLTNIIAGFDPDNKRRIILGTHYDSKRFADQDKNNPADPVPGANDSASGVAVLLELARYLANVEKKPAVGVDLVFFDGEEGEEDLTKTDWQPLGSNYLAKNLSQIYRGQKPTAAIIIDMVCDRDLNVSVEGNSLERAPRLARDFLNIARQLSPRNFSERPLKIWDDHIPLNDAGIPSILLIDYDYPYFHTTQDTFDKCGAKSLETVGNALLSFILNYR